MFNQQTLHFLLYLLTLIWYFTTSIPIEAHSILDKPYFWDCLGVFLHQKLLICENGKNVLFFGHCIETDYNFK